MAYSARNCIFMVTILAGLSLAIASTFKVGGADGWTSSKNVNYTKWAGSIHFQVNDVLSFVYDNKTENVLRVSQHHYASCNVTEPVKKWTSGNDSFNLPKSGHFFFVSSVDGKSCQGKAKLNVKVYANNDDEAKAPSVPSSGSITNAPAPKHSAATLTVKGLFGSLFLSLIMLVINYLN